MKKLTLILALSAASTFVQATIYRIGFPGIPVVGKDFNYGDFATAHNNASAGDTIQMYQQFFPSSININVTKPLRIFGYGYNLSTNTGLQVANLPDSNTRMIYISLSSGSTGTIIQGLHLNGLVIYDSNITARRCLLYQTYTACPSVAITGYPDNCIIEACFFKGITDSTNYSTICPIDFNTTYSVKNFKFINNVLSGGMIIQGGAEALHTGLIANNIFLNKKGFGRHPSFMNLLEIKGFSTFLIKNNIFYYDSIKSKEVWSNSFFESQLEIPSGCVFQNNVSNIPAAYNLWGVTNQFGVSNLFAAGFNNGYFTSETGVQLAAGSPALTAGKNNAGAATQCGIYGGESAQTYRLSGIPAIPSIYLLSAPSQNANTNPYNVNISTKSNN